MLPKSDFSETDRQVLCVLDAGRILMWNIQISAKSAGNVWDGRFMQSICKFRLNGKSLSRFWERLVQGDTHMTLFFVVIYVEFSNVSGINIQCSAYGKKCSGFRLPCATFYVRNTTVTQVAVFSKLFDRKILFLSLFSDKSSGFLIFCHNSTSFDIIVHDKRHICHDSCFVFVKFCLDYLKL